MKYAALLTNTAEDVARWATMTEEEGKAARALELPKWNALFEELMGGGNWVGGYFVFECATIDEACEWAARIPGARHGAIEVRPIHVDEEVQS